MAAAQRLPLSLEAVPGTQQILHALSRPCLHSADPACTQRILHSCTHLASCIHAHTQQILHALTKWCV
jgi:hypothetical protein